MHAAAGDLEVAEDERVRETKAAIRAAAEEAARLAAEASAIEEQKEKAQRLANAERRVSEAMVELAAAHADAEGVLLQQSEDAPSTPQYWYDTRELSNQQGLRPW